MRNATNGLHQEDASEVHTRVCISSVKGVADSAVSIMSLIIFKMGLSFCKNFLWIKPFCIFLFIFQSPTICMKRYQRPLACLSWTRSTRWSQLPNLHALTIRTVPVSLRPQKDEASNASLANTVWRKENIFSAPIHRLPRLLQTLSFSARGVS